MIMKYLEKDAMMQDMNQQEETECNGGIGLWMYIDPVVSILISDAVEKTNSGEQ